MIFVRTTLIVFGYFVFSPVFCLMVALVWLSVYTSVTDWKDCFKNDIFSYSPIHSLVFSRLVNVLVSFYRLSLIPKMRF